MAKERLIERLKTRNPDKDYMADEEALYADTESYIGELDDYKSRSDMANKEIIAVMKSHPNVSAFLRDLVNGASEMEALARNFDIESLTPMEGDPDMESWKKGKADRMAKQQERDTYESTLQQNSNISAKVMQEFVAEKGMSEEDAMTFLDSVEAIVMDAMDGKIEKTTLDRLYVAANAESDKTAAVEEAVLATKNAKIEAESAPMAKGDGLPNLKGGAAPAAPKKPGPFDDAFAAQARRNRFS